MVTYYIGAGASCGRHSALGESPCLPLVSEIPDRLSRLAAQLEGLGLPDTASFDGLSESRAKTCSRLIDSARDLERQARLHYSVDTYAKMLYVRRNNPALTQLKATLSALFMVEQGKVPHDPRYDAFWAAILERGETDPVLPSNVRVLSWNYDSQLELAFVPFLTDTPERGSRLCSLLQSFPAFEGLVAPDAIKIDEDHFSILHLNGIAGAQLVRDQGFARLYPKPGHDNSSLISMVRQWGHWTHDQLAPELMPLINFAHEEEDLFTRTLRPHVDAVAKQTTTLVAIGYSFPLFNRAVDRRIIGAMEPLTKVYVQAPASSRADILERLSWLLPRASKVKIEYRDGLDQFVVPPELDRR